MREDLQCSAAQNTGMHRSNWPSLLKSVISSIPIVKIASVQLIANSIFIRHMSERNEHFRELLQKTVTLHE